MKSGDGQTLLNWSRYWKSILPPSPQPTPPPTQLSLPPLVYPPFPPPTSSAMAIQNRTRRIVELVREDRTRTAMATSALDAHILYHVGNGKGIKTCTCGGGPTSMTGIGIYGEPKNEGEQIDELEVVKIVGVPATVHFYNGQCSNFQENPRTLANEHENLKEAAQQVATTKMPKREYTKESDVAVPSSSLLRRKNCTISRHSIRDIDNFHQKKKQNMKEKKVNNFNQLEMKWRYDLLVPHKDQVEISTLERCRHTAVKHIDVIRKTVDKQDLTMKRNVLARLQSNEVKEDKELSLIFGRKIMFLKRAD